MFITRSRLISGFGHNIIRNSRVGNALRHFSARRCYSSENQEDKSLFSLDIDVLEWAHQKSPEKEIKLTKSDVTDTETSPTKGTVSQDDILADFLLDTESESSPTSLDQLLKKFSNDDFSDISQNSTNYIDDDFLSLEQENSFSRSSKQDMNKFSHELNTKGQNEHKERDLFLEMCEKYSQFEEDATRLRDLLESVLSTLQDSYSKPNKKAEGKLNKRAEGIKTVLEKERVLKDLELQFADALSGTTEYLSTLNRAELMTFCKDFIARFKSGDYEKSLFRVKRLRNELEEEYIERQKLVCKEVEAASIARPQEPLLTMQTMPILFNHVLKLMCSKFYDGSSALTLFNIAKKDISLYAILCNQTTYNKILKLYWVFYGKSTLYEVELTVVEMLHNGFKGNLETFAILKEILTSYHTMRMGKTVYNPCGMPIWSEEDERRALNLGHKLKRMGDQFKDKRFYMEKGLY